MSLTDLGSTLTARTLTPSDTVSLKPMPRAIRVGTGGTVKVTAALDTSPVTIVNVQDGEYLPVSVKRLWATGTTATDFTGFY